MHQPFSYYPVINGLHRASLRDERCWEEPVHRGNTFSQEVYSTRALLLGRFSEVQLFATLRTAACHVALCTGFCRREHWRGLPWPPLANLPGPRTNASLQLLHWPVGSLTSAPPGKPRFTLGSLRVLPKTLPEGPSWRSTA